MIGESVDHYKIIQRLGDGGMGVVYKARDTRLDRYVALKFLPADLIRNPDAKALMIHEARTASALDHPNICTIHDIDETESGQLFISMAYYDGRTMKDLIAQKPLSIEDSVDVTIQIAQGLARAHREGIVHGDIKPANIMITRDGLAKILDFGLAKIAGAPESKRTGIAGTASYMAPEQITGEKSDHRTDIWAIGILLYEMLTGQRPFSGIYEEAVMYEILNSEPVPAHQLRPELPGELTHIIETALQKNPIRRFMHTEDLLNELWTMAHQFQFSMIRKRQISGTDASISLAILPFFNLSMDTSEDYFCEGFSQDIRDTLAAVGKLRVTPHSRVLNAREQHEDIRDLGHELNAEALLEGVVRRSEGRLRVTVQLINVISGNHLWADRYDKPESDILAIKEEICLSVINQLGLQIDDQEKRKITRHPTGSITAYDAYLHGKHSSHQYRKETLYESLYHFKVALQDDPGFADAYTGYAKSLFWLGTGFFNFPPSEMLSDASEAINSALDLGSHSAETYAVSAAITHRYHNKWNEAERKFLRTLEIEPGSVFTHHNYALLKISLGRHSEALEHSGRALSLNSRDFLANLHEGLVRYYSGDFTSAIDSYQNALQIIEDNASLHTLTGFAYSCAGKTDLACEQFEIAREFSESSAFCLAGKAYGLALTERTTEAETLLEELEHLSGIRYVTATGLARVYAALGQFDRTSESLLRAKDEMDPWLPFIGSDPVFQQYRKTPEFSKISEQILPEVPNVLKQ